MADDRNRDDAEDVGRPADEEIIGTGEDLDDESELDELDEDESEDESADEEA